MFIAVNANKPPSPFGGADEQVAIYPLSQYPLLRTEKVVFCCSKTINISPLTERRQEPICHQRCATGFSMFELLDCCCTSEAGAVAGSRRSGITLRFYLDFVCLRAGMFIFGGSVARRTSSWVKAAKINGCASRKRAKSPRVRPRCNSLSSSMKI